MFHPVIINLRTMSEVDVKFSKMFHLGNTGHEAFEMFQVEVMVFIET